jgi:hypothetical protein
MLMALYNRSHPAEVFRWRLVSGETLKMKIALPAIMTAGPRWNTHAIIATAGPLHIREVIEIDAATANRSATSWSVVVCTFPGMKTITNLSSGSETSANAVLGVTLKPGRYWMGLRYYRVAEDVTLPLVRIDGKDAIPSLRISPQTNSFYKNLVGKSSFFYLCLHYYVWTMLLYRNFLPARTVERHYLPLGNPDTEFFFGTIRATEALRIVLKPEILTSYEVYLTFYSRASFPVSWQVLLHEETMTQPVDRPCSYLVRVRKSRPSADPFDRSWIGISAAPGNHL